MIGQKEMLGIILTEAIEADYADKMYARQQMAALNAKMRDCDDVPKFIQKVNRAQKLAAKSKLRFK